MKITQRGQIKSATKIRINQLIHIEKSGISILGWQIPCCQFMMDKYSLSGKNLKSYAPACMRALAKRPAYAARRNGLKSFLEEYYLDKNMNEPSEIIRLHCVRQRYARRPSFFPVCATATSWQRFCIMQRQKFLHKNAFYILIA